MPKSEENQEYVDPIVLAAMIEDENEDDEDKKLREEILGTPASDNDSDDEDDKKSKKPKSDEDEDDSNDDDSDDDSEDDEDDEVKKPKKPIEAEDDDDSEDDEEEDEDEDNKKSKPSRKERRQQRQEDFLASIRKDTKSGGKPNIPDYKPLDYDAVPRDENGEEREFKPEELVQDREMYAAVSFARGAAQVKEAAEQDRFWSELGTESKILAYDPELNFLSETTPDGKKNPYFDPDRAEEVNAMYLQLCGAEQYQATNEQGQPLFNSQTGQPIMMIRVRDTGISYDKFARGYVKRMKDWAEDFADSRVEETRENITKQRRNQSIRPGSGKRKTLGALKPGDISNMSDEDLEKNEAEIDRQIDAMLGL